MAVDPQDPQTGRRILIVRLSALGDLVHVLPLLDALRRARPDATLGWLVEERHASLLADHPQLDRVFAFPRRELAARLRSGRVLAALALALRFVRELRAARFEVTIDAQCNLRSSVLAWLSGAPRRIGFAPPYTKEKAHWLSTDRVAVPRGAQLKVERNLELLRPLAIDGRGARPRLAVPAAARAAARALRAEQRTAELVALHPGVSGFGSFKQWDPERFAAVARRLSSERGARSLVTWGPGERELALRVVEASEGSAALAPETRSILELAALYEVCDAVVGGDTGPIHLAAALGVPVLGLYGPKDPAVYAPWDGLRGRAAATIWKGVPCSPCALRRCDNVICMPAIEVEDVTAALARALCAEDAAGAPRVAAGAEARG
jgi:lipopolysaccharide heptosyltransferase I